MSRRRWRFTRNGLPCEPYEVDLDAPNPTTSAGQGPVTDLYMDGVRATDGTDIGSRKKRREYMHANGLIDADDMKGEWAKAAAQREKIRDGSGDTQARREAVIEALRKARR